jgi:hypothetical protein
MSEMMKSGTWNQNLLSVFCQCFFVTFRLETVSTNMTFTSYLWEGPASQPQSTLSCCKKNPTVNKKKSDPPKLGSKKTVAIIAFRIAWTLDVKILWFGRQVAACVQKRHKNEIFGCSWFQKFNFDCLLI